MKNVMHASGGFNLSAWALAHRQLVAFLMLMVTVTGVMSFLNLPRSEDPAFTIKIAVVSAQWPGATVKDTVSFVTDTLEKKLQEIPHLDYIESYTRPGSSVIFVNLRDDTPPSEVAGIWYSVRKKMDDIRASLPDGTTTPAVDDEFDDTYGTIYGFTSDGFTPRQLRDTVDDIRTSLLAVPGTGKVTLLGDSEQQVVIAFDPLKLSGMGLDLQQVTAALQAQNAVTPAGRIRTSQENMSVEVSGAFTSVDSLRQIVLHTGNRFIPLTDLATVTLQQADPPSPEFRVNGKPALGLAISMARGGNIVDFGRALNATMDRIRTHLPYGISVEKVADQSAVVSDAVGGFVQVLVEAVIIVLAVSFVSLGSRAGLVVAVAIPLVLAMTFTGMELAGIGLQRISLGALIIALGLLVDDAMITVEAMVSRLEAGDALSVAATQVFRTTAFPMLTGTLVMIAGFIPVGFAASSAGEYCYSLFVVVLTALLSSWLVAVLFSPLTGVWLLPEQHSHQSHKHSFFHRHYTRLLDRVMQHRRKTLGCALAILILSGGGALLMQGEFFPASDRPELLVSLTLPQNVSQAQTHRDVLKFEAKLRDNPDIDHYSSYIGSGAVRFYLPMDVLLQKENIAQLVVVAKNEAARNRLQKQLEQILSKDFSTLTTRVSTLELGPPVGWPVRYRVSGPDNTRVRELATQLAGMIARNPDTRGVNLTSGEPERVIRLRVDQTQARATGMTSQSLAGTLATLFSGTTVTTLRDRNRQIDVVLRGNEASRQNPALLNALMLTSSTGNKVPLGQVATPEWTLDDPVIWRRQRLPFITVQSDTAPGVRAETVSSALSPVVAGFRESLPPGYSVEEGGVVVESEKGNSSVYAVLPVTLMVMLLLLMIQLQRFSSMLLALLMAPFGLPGIVVAMLPFGIPMGFVALLGIIALAGMIIRNAVILISEVDVGMKNGFTADEAIKVAALHRSRPIMLTASAAILGMLPIARDVFWGPMAFAIIGGLLSATLATLTLLPAAISLIFHWKPYP
ncbi:TPA: efflux RND transporter permease subunit [Enterobacter hormaechei]